MTNLFDTFLWRVAIIAGIVAALIVIAMLARAIRALRHEIQSRGRHGSQTPLAETRDPAPGAGALPVARHSTPARRATARDIAQNGIFHDAA